MYVCMYSQTSLTGSAYVDNQLKLMLFVWSNLNTT